MDRRLLQTLVLAALILVPLVAWAGDSAIVCADGAGGSDTGKFAQALKEHGTVVALGLAFVSGVLASLTPCVYPMVPITISIFGATSEGTTRARSAGLSGAFVLGIAALFTPMGLISVFTGSMMGAALSNAYVVIALATLFIALAASMFGAFELALPSGLTNKLSTVGGVGYKGAFIMGLVMGLIAAPCTGPFLTGMLIVIADKHDYLLGGSALFTFSLGLGVIFFVAGAFGANLPKAGAWMMGIKWVSGVGLAYMAFTYLRDKFEPIRKLVAHPGYGFGGVAIAILVVGAILGGIHIVAERRKSPIAHLSKRMKLLSIVPAVAGAAMLFSWLPLNHEPEVATTGDAPPITWLTTEQAALAKANSEGKPLFIDFGAEWCKACKELEHDTFPDKTVRAEAQRYVALRVDATDDEDPEIIRLRAKYNIKGLPTVVFLDKTGKEVTRFNDFVKPDKFAVALKCNANAAGKAPERVGMNP